MFLSPSDSDSDSGLPQGKDPATSSMMDFLYPGTCSDPDGSPNQTLSPYFTDSESDNKPDLGLTDIRQGQEVPIIIDEKVDTLAHRIHPFKKEWITGPDRPTSYNDDLRLSRFTPCAAIWAGGNGNKSNIISRTQFRGRIMSIAP